MAVEHRRISTGGLHRWHGTFLIYTYAFTVNESIIATSQYIHYLVHFLLIYLLNSPCISNFNNLMSICFQIHPPGCTSTSSSICLFTSQSVWQYICLSISFSIIPVQPTPPHSLSLSTFPILFIRGDRIISERLNHITLCFFDLKTTNIIYYHNACICTNNSFYQAQS